MHFAWIDWVIVGVYLVGSMVVGLAGRKLVGNVSHYLVAGRELGPYIGIATLAATEIGTITFMYNAELGYRYGFAAFAMALISGAAMIFVGRTGFVIARLRKLELMTVPEFFEVKYSPGLRLLAGCLVAIGGILNMGVFLRIEGQFLMIITGINPKYLVEIMTGILLLELVYTSIGGMVSVVITDYLQYVLLSLATIVISIYAVHYVGWHTMVSKVTTTMGSQGFNPFTSTKFGLKFLLWQIVWWLALHTCWQTTAMRVFSTRGPEVSKKVMTWTGMIFLGRGMLPMLWGIAAMTLYGLAPNASGVSIPLVDGHVMAPIDAMPALLAQMLGIGVRGIVVAGMLAATMSVNSSYILGWSGVISQDVIAPIRRFSGKPALSVTSQVTLNRICNVFIGLFLLFWGLYYTPPGAVYLYLNITSTIFLAGAFVCILGALYWKRTSILGGYMAMLLGGAGAIVPFFFLHRSESFAGFTAFLLAACGLIFGSLIYPSPQRLEQPL